MNQEKVGKKGYTKYKNKANEYLNDREKAMGLLENAKEKAEKKKGPLHDAWEKIQLFFSVFDDWVKGRYKVIPFKSIAMITVGIIYFVMPLDLIPDFIVGLGFGDDAAVLVFIFKQISKDLDEYKKWKEQQKQDEEDNTVLIIDPEEEK
ncbi:MAG: YkvA family protein [Eubacteriales bacterium]